MELKQIADVTKVGIRTLRLIEDDAYEELPATVYVRGFVTAYLQTLGIDPDRVVASYVQRVEESRSDQGRGRFLGRG
jgi:flagellar biosynthesis protein FlhG